MTFLGQRSRVQASRSKSSLSFTFGNEYTVATEIGKKRVKKRRHAKLKHGHSIFKSLDFEFLLIGFPYCSMRQLIDIWIDSISWVGNKPLMRTRMMPSTNHGSPAGAEHIANTPPLKVHLGDPARMQRLAMWSPFPMIDPR